MRPRPRFEPRDHREPLVALISELVARPDLDQRKLDAMIRKYPRDGKALFSRSQIIAGFRAFGPECGWPLDEATFLARLRKRPVRTLSGVAPLTVLTKPFPCPGRCIFCPSDVRMPKSYLAREPGAQRATQNRFDPYRQTLERLRAFHELGHAIDKIELIVLGGTWSFYPERYRIWFLTRCFQALNDFSPAAPAPAGEPAGIDFLDLDRVVRAGGGDGAYNRIVSGHLRSHHGGELLATREHGDWRELERAQRRNESAGSRCVGLSIETRPDHVDRGELRRLRRMGVTKVQLGYQSLSDRVLAANRRGHDVARAREATRLLRGAGFKLQGHWMPNLYGSSPDADRRDYARLFDDPDFRPDELKVYPCSLVESAELATRHASGEWLPYAEEDLVELLADCIEATPAYCRLTRIVRDISAQDIVAGSRKANLREVAEARLAARGGVAREIRAREIRGREFEAAEVELVELRYATSIGSERFLQMVAAEGRLLAFLRLALPGREAPLTELAGSALIRELHVYGALAPLGSRDRAAAQHRGFGRRLVGRAAEIAAETGFGDLAVISAVGTRGYYERLGFARGELYHHAEPGGLARDMARGRGG